MLIFSRADSFFFFFFVIVSSHKYEVLGACWISLHCTRSYHFRTLPFVEKENHMTLRLHKGLRIAVLYFWKTFNYSLQSKAFLMETKWPPIAKIFFLFWQALRWVMIWRYYIPASNNLLHSSVSHCTVIVSDTFSSCFLVCSWNWSVKILLRRREIRFVKTQLGLGICAYCKTDSRVFLTLSALGTPAVWKSEGGKCKDSFLCRLLPWLSAAPCLHGGL